MAIQTLTLAGKRFVVLPETEYRKLTGKSASKRKPQRIASRNSQDAGDLAEHRRRLKEPGGTSLERVRQRLGL